MLKNLTDAQLLRLYRKLIVRACDRLDVSSFDMPTLYACIPELCDAIRAVKTEGALRKKLSATAGEYVAAN